MPAATVRSALPALAALAAGALALAAAPAPAAPPAARDLLVFYTYGRMLPGNLEFESGLRRALAEAGGAPIEVFEEFLDLEHFDRPEYLRAMETYLREKYSARPPAAIVVAGGGGLGFLIERRDRLFPGVPVVHAALDTAELDRLRPLPSDVHGLPQEIDFRGTIDAALRLHPEVRRLVLVTGAAEIHDRRVAARLRIAARGLESRVTVEHLEARPHREVLARLAALGSDAVVVSPGYFADGDGLTFLPRDSVRAMASASAAPVYSCYSTMLDTGVVGGSWATFEAIGHEAGREVAALARGASAEPVGLPETLPPALHLDGRQLRKWGVEWSRVPAGAVVHFEEPGFLEAHWRESLAAGLVIAVQAALIGLLVAERRRRRSAELSRQTLRAELMHASRLAVAGELVASIAHEINQPLGAIQANADAGEMMLASGADRREDLRAILADIRRDDQRASEVIRRLRALLAKGEVEQRSFDLVEAVRDVERVLSPEARRRGVALELRLPGSRLEVHGDRVQLQQVVINLALNAMDAVAGEPEARRRVEISMVREPGKIALAVRDQGPGIPAEHLAKLFESFFTTKRGGMGLGLAIARTIVEAHGGRIRAENAPEGGAAFVVELPMPGRQEAPPSRP